MESIYERLKEIERLEWVAELTCEVVWPLNLLTIEMIDIVSEFRGKGKGSEVMARIITIADDNGLSIRLRPDDRYGTPMRVLERFYEKSGFKWESSTSEYVYN